MSVSKTGKAKIAPAEDSGERSPAEADVSSSEGHVSFGDIIEGTATQQATPFERKAALVNAEIDKFGFGKYQQCIWVLCGFGYFLDLAWTQGVGLMVTAVLIGAFSFGILTDIIGRKWAFNLTCLITSVFGILLAAVKYNYAAICGIYFLSSVGLGGNIPIDAAIALEFLPQDRRFLVALLGIWQPIGVVVASAISYGTAAKYKCDVKLPACNAVGVSPGDSCCSVSSNMGWRYEVIAIGLITFVVFFVRCLIFRFHESPKFLISKGRDQDAIDVLRKIAKFNKAPAPTLTIEYCQQINSDTGSESGSIKSKSPKNVALGFFKSFKHLRGLFTCKAECFSFALLAVAYMGDYWSFTLAGSFLPIILLRNNVESGGNVTETYRQYIYIYLPGIIGAVIALFSIQLPLIGRKWSLVIAATLQGVSMALYTQVKNTAGYVGLNALEYIMQTVSPDSKASGAIGVTRRLTLVTQYFNAVLYASAPEMFNTT
ncbi:unnamed protein product [Penicillium salamii]|nr:unnamed protein product [Penicillium salamii]CAG8338628.1 unnamed protein product [Penicillium salamii]